MPGIDYDSAINVHICSNGVPRRAGGYVSGMSAAYENQALEVCNKKIILRRQSGLGHWCCYGYLKYLFPLFQWHACKLAELSACIAKCMTTINKFYFLHLHLR